MIGYLVKLPQNEDALPVIYEHENEDGVLDYHHFNVIKTLCAHDVDLWQIVNFSLGGIVYTMLVDEEGLLKDSTTGNLVATLLARYGYPIVGDVFICRTKGEDLVYMTPSERDNLVRHILSKGQYNSIPTLTLW